MAETTPQRLGKYELQERLGRGGMAEVWKALDSQLQRYVALKILHADLQNDPEFVTRFEREARIIAGLHHPNIVQLHDFQLARTAKSNVTTAYMIMDYIQGPTLADYIAHTSGKRQFPAATQIVHLFTAIGLAVDYAHQKGVIHRDLKPANILLDQRNTTHSSIGEPILTDFGMVKLLGASTTVLSSSRLSTPFYVAPEQAQGYPGNERSDIYALGVILYEICTGVLPFQGENATDILKQHISALPPSPTSINPHIPPPLAMVILRCLAKDPMARFARAAALAAALASAFNLPLPDRLPSQPGFLSDVAKEPTLYKPTEPTLSSEPIPVASSSPGVPAALSTPQSGARTPQTTAQVGGSSTSLASPSQATPIPVSAYPATQKRHRGLLLTLLILLILLVLGSGLGTAFWLTHQGNTTPVVMTGSQVVGSAFFVSSGQLNEGNSQGINDELQLNLQNIAEPAAGQSYYAWLLGDLNKPATKPLLLGMLPVTHGGVQFLYPGDQQHSNLIATYSRLLITEEPTTTAPPPPSSDHHPWRFYAELPQIPIPTGNHFSALDHLRNLFYEGTILHLLGIHGGLNIQLLRHTQKVWEWVSSARDSWSASNITAADFVHRQIVRTLDYLDGTPLLQKDVPAGTPLLVNKLLAQVPLVNIVKNKGAPSYIDRAGGELNRLVRSPGITSVMNAIATKDGLALYNNVQTWLENLRQDAKRLVYMTDTQLLQPSTLLTLDNMVTQATYALVGRLDPTTNEVQSGVVQIYYDIQRLATFNLMPYTSR